MYGTVPTKIVSENLGIDDKKTFPEQNVRNRFEEVQFLTLDLLVFLRVVFLHEHPPDCVALRQSHDQLNHFLHVLMDIKPTTDFIPIGIGELHREWHS